MKKITIGTLAYLVLTFAWAVVWHIVLLRDLYVKIGYFGDQEPNLLLGFLAILTQGLVMNYAYARIYNGAGRRLSPWIFATACGLFLHSTHVVAYAAKQPVQLALFTGIESLYLAVQFALFAWVLRLLYSERA